MGKARYVGGVSPSKQRKAFVNSILNAAAKLEYASASGEICQNGKERFDFCFQAEAAIAVFAKSKREYRKAHPYGPCRFCNGWHIGGLEKEEKK